MFSKKKNYNKQSRMISPRKQAKSRFVAAHQFIQVAKSRSLTSNEFAQLGNCIRLLRKSNSPKPLKPINIIRLRCLFIDFEALVNRIRKK